MIDVVGKKCVGCFSCSSVCPNKCISVTVERDGFFYPAINYKKCVKCGLCDNSCPVLNVVANSVFKQVAYAAKNNNEEEVKKSSSGGVFIALANSIIEEGGVVFGAAYDSNFNVIHNFAQNKETVKNFQGSKYVQSNTENSFTEVRKFLSDKRKVLFSGTPCQIAGLKAFLGKNYDNLLTIDIACHGVPSPFVFKKYLSFLKSKFKGEIVKVDFRKKTNGWEDYEFSVDFDSGESFCEHHENNLMMQAFLKNYCLRESCYNCKFKGLNRNSDITLCDFWGIKENFPDLYEQDGVSLVLLNSEKGFNELLRLKNKVKFNEVDLNNAIKNNPALIKSAYRPIGRDVFIKLIKKNEFDKAIKTVEKKTPRLTRIKVYKEDVYNTKNSSGLVRAMLFAIKHFWKAYF
ncbi:MAG: Coenzyme F420 hydrogenase/dehydrogenase, beta subunit C-terminal domain [Clostridia bacterium]|nr:Coenzyme F420 hydrogenase/dehydrogenase, beta subunit C-terminal domain [Clostridia bacterium]